MFKGFKRLVREKDETNVDEVPDFSHDKFDNSVNTMTYSERRSFIDKKYKALILESKLEKAKKDKDKNLSDATVGNSKDSSAESKSTVDTSDKELTVESENNRLHKEQPTESDASAEANRTPQAFVDRTTGEYISAQNLNSVPRHIVEDMRNRENYNLHNQLAEKDEEIASLKAKLLQKKEEDSFYESKSSKTAGIPANNIDFNNSVISENNLDSLLDSVPPEDTEPDSEANKGNNQKDKQTSVAYDFQSATDLSNLDSENRKVLNEQKQIIHQNILKIMGK